MTARPLPYARALLIGLGLWILAGLLGLLAATLNGPFGDGFSWLDLVARLTALAAALYSLGAIFNAASDRGVPSDDAVPAEPAASAAPDHRARERDSSRAPIQSGV
jgi:hypothetical protein